MAAPGPVIAYRREHLPAELPIFPLPGVLLLPRGRLPLNIFEPRYLAMTDDALKSDRLIGMIQPGSAAGLYATGCAGRITSLTETVDGRYLITLTGICRFHIGAELATTTPYRRIRPQFEFFHGDLDNSADAADFDRPRLLTALKRYLELNKMAADWPSIEGAETEGLVNSLAMICPFEPQEKQALLEAPDLTTRALTLIALIEMATADPYGDDKPPLQ